MFGDFLYQLTPRDEQGSVLIPFFFSQNNTGSATTVTVNVNAIDARFVLWIQSVSVTLAPGAGQICRGWRLNAFNDLTPAITIASDTAPTNTADIDLNQSKTLNMLLSPQTDLQLRGLFNAGTNSNSATFDVFGWLLPRGNLSLT